MKKDRDLDEPEEFIVDGKRLNFEEIVERMLKIDKKELESDFKKDEKPTEPPKSIKKGRHHGNSD